MYRGVAECQNSYLFLHIRDRRGAVLAHSHDISGLRLIKSMLDQGVFLSFPL